MDNTTDIANENVKSVAEAKRQVEQEKWWQAEDADRRMIKETIIKLLSSLAITESDNSFVINGIEYDADKVKRILTAYCNADSRSFSLAPLLEPFSGKLKKTLDSYIRVGVPCAYKCIGCGREYTEQTRNAIAYEMFCKEGAKRSERFCEQIASIMLCIPQMLKWYQRHIGNEPASYELAVLDAAGHEFISLCPLCVSDMLDHSEFHKQKARKTPCTTALLRQTIADAKEHGLLIDGANLALNFSNYGSKALIALLSEIEKSGYPVCVVFDANIRYKLKERKDDVGLMWLTDFEKNGPEICSIVASGTRADDNILQYADAHGCHVISCDRYSDFRERYPWLKKKIEDGARLHPVSLIRNELIVPGLGLNVKMEA